jgi:Uma2 family endonuclease
MRSPSDGNAAATSNRQDAMSEMALEFQLRPFNVEEYHRMAETGIIGDRERVELLDGLLIRMPPIGPVHWGRHGHIVEYLIEALRGRARVFGQASIPLETRSEPQPDIVVLANRPRGYSSAPSNSEIFAMIELAESSLAQDRGRKLRLYARSGIPDYLLVDLAGNVLHHFTKPHEPGYAGDRVLGYAETFSLSSIPDVALSADPFLALL